MNNLLILVYKLETGFSTMSLCGVNLIYRLGKSCFGLFCIGETLTLKLYQVSGFLWYRLEVEWVF